VKRGDAKAKKLLDEASRLVGLGISNLSLAIDPSLVVLGGPLVEVREFLSTVRQVVAGVIPSPPEIVPARLGEESALWGSLLVATQEARNNLRQNLAHEIVPTESEDEEPIAVGGR
jgi:glucokinase